MTAIAMAEAKLILPSGEAPPAKPATSLLPTAAATSDSILPRTTHSFRRGTTTLNATNSRALDALSLLQPTPGVSPIFGFWRTYFREADFYSVRNRAALMPGSMDSPPIFTSMRSTRRCESFLFPSRTLSYTANRYTPLCRDEPPGGTAVSR